MVKLNLKVKFHQEMIICQLSPEKEHYPKVFWICFITVNHILIVEEINDKEASIIYTRGFIIVPEYLPGSCTRYKAEVVGNTLQVKVNIKGNDIYYIYQTSNDGRLVHATFKDHTYILKCNMRKMEL